jgi:prepilin-type N-terminal cleavage/methylation domain-containing protein
MSAMPNKHRLVLFDGATMRTGNCRRSPCSPAVSAGFSLVELMVVMAIILVVSAFAIPTMTTTMDGIRLRGALGSASNIAQRCRTQAIKKNLSQRLHFSAAGSTVALYVTDWTDTAVTPVPGDPSLSAQVWLPSQFSIPGVPTGAGAPPALTSNGMWGTVLGLNVNVDPYFNSRGLPYCLPAAGACTPGGGFVYYYKYKNAGHTRWIATSISPAGRIQSWLWNGTTWGN